MVLSPIVADPDPCPQVMIFNSYVVWLAARCISGTLIRRPRSNLISAGRLSPSRACAEVLGELTETTRSRVSPGGFLGGSGVVVDQPNLVVHGAFKADVDFKDLQTQGTTTQAAVRGWCLF